MVTNSLRDLEENESLRKRKISIILWYLIFWDRRINVSSKIPYFYFRKTRKRRCGSLLENWLFPRVCWFFMVWGRFADPRSKKVKTKIFYTPPLGVKNASVLVGPKKHFTSILFSQFCWKVNHSRYGVSRCSKMLTCRDSKKFMSHVENFGAPKNRASKHENILRVQKSATNA